MENTCILYSATNKKYVNEAMLCANITRKYVPEDIPIILHTNHSVTKTNVFDEIIIDDNTLDLCNKKYAWKILGMIKVLETTTYDRVLFLDSDAAIVDKNTIGIFQLLEQFDLAVAHAHPHCRTWGKPITTLPISYPEFNTGVVLYKSSMYEIFKKWLHVYMNDIVQHPHDQGAFRYVTYNSTARIATLPAEYNNRDQTRRATPESSDCYIWHQRACFKHYEK